MHTATVLSLALCLAPAAFAHDGWGGPDTTTSVSPNTQCWQTQNPHDYEMAPIPGTDLMARESTKPAWVVVVGDYNLDDCNGDAEIDYDGDMEYGFGGARFIIDTPDPCRHAHEVAHHGKTISVVDDFRLTTSFTVGADPSPYAAGCVDDGAITPSVNGDDWLYHCVDFCTVPPAVLYGGNSRTTDPGPGGEIWVFVEFPAVRGHIWSS